MKQAVIGSLLAAVAMFLWGFVFWSLNPVMPIKSSPDGEAIGQVLLNTLPDDGVYFVPSYDDDDFAEQHARGPLARVFYVREGASVMHPSVFVFGFLHVFVVALLLSFVLAFGGAYASSYRRRVCLVATAGLAAAVFSNVGAVVWFYSPWAHHLNVMVYDFVSFLIAGLILARFVRPVAEAAPQ